MRMEHRLIGNLSIRSFFTAILMIGAFLVVYGFLKRLAEGGHLLECLLGIVVSMIAIVIAAIPPRKSDSPPFENALEDEQE